MNQGLIYKLKNIKKRYIITIIVVVCIILILTYFSKNDLGEGLNTYVIESMTISENIEETGIVEAADEADLSFKDSGQIGSINVDEGDHVNKGDILAVLENAEARADILSAQADVQSREAELADLMRNAMGTNGEALAIVKKQQDSLVENAYILLLSSGLVAEASSDTYTQTPPIITGRYTGPEGTYKIIVNTGTQSDDYEMSVFNLEKVRDVDISETGKTALGTYGLYIEFPDTLNTYANTIWYVDIPNTKSSVYLSNYNAYTAAVETRDVTVENALANPDNLAAYEATLLKAQANLAKVQAAYGDTVITAPFDGIITNIEGSVGESVSPTDLVVSMISDSKYEITVLIPEADIRHLTIGDRAIVTFDAYDEEVFEAEVVFITPSAETVEGVPVFEAKLEFKEQDSRIFAGLSADVEIIAEVRENVLAVPTRSIIRENGGAYVRVMQDGRIIRKEVEIGLRSSDGFTEILTGLREGEEIITFIDAETLEKLGGE